MSIISRIIRMLGYKIVRYSDPLASSKKIAGLHPDISAREPLIEKGEAMKALESVGRETNVRSFTYHKRPDKSSEQMDRLENLWWNANGRLIEKVWVFSEDVNRNYRNAYVNKAAAFFRQTGIKAKILDLGCGSGWFGRMIADSGLEYHGMDFSSTQIDIANGEKERSANKDYLHYYCLQDFKKIENIHTITGVVIHAFLHHLYWKDLYLLFDELVKVLPDGCRFFIMEPVYPDLNKSESNFPEQTPNNNLITAYRENLNVIKNDLIDKNLYDTETESELMKLGSESDKNGFFLSPKEVPFRLKEFREFLTKYLRVENTFHCGVLNLETAQLVERINPVEIQHYYSDLLFPLVNSLDQFLMSNHYFEANPNNYLFTAFECTLTKSGK